MFHPTCPSQLTGTLSHVLGKATFDTSYQEEREQILESCQTSGDHLKAGLMGLSSGVFGGMMSMVTQPIKDTRSYGITVSTDTLCTVCVYVGQQFKLHRIGAHLGISFDASTRENSR